MCCLVEKVIPPKVNRTASSGNIRGYLGGLFSVHQPKGDQKRGKEYIVRGKPGKNTGYSVAKPKRNLFVSFSTADHKTFASPTFPKAAKSILDKDTIELAREFKFLAMEWKNDTRLMSSLSDMFMHPAYQRIMSMGKPALPFILGDLRHNSGHWFHALRYIVGKDIAAGTRRVSDARDAWLGWGHKNGLI